MRQRTILTYGDISGELAGVSTRFCQNTGPIGVGAPRRPIPNAFRGDQEILVHTWLPPFTPLYGKTDRTTSWSAWRLPWSHRGGVWTRQPKIFPRRFACTWVVRIRRRLASLPSHASKCFTTWCLLAPPEISFRQGTFANLRQLRISAGKHGR